MVRIESNWRTKDNVAHLVSDHSIDKCPDLREVAPVVRSDAHLHGGRLGAPRVFAAHRIGTVRNNQFPSAEALGVASPLPGCVLCDRKEVAFQAVGPCGLFGEDHNAEAGWFARYGQQRTQDQEPHSVTLAEGATP